MNLTAWAEDLSEGFLGDSPPSLSGEKRLFRLLPESAAIELRLLESDSSLLSSSLFLLACKVIVKENKHLTEILIGVIYYEEAMRLP